MAQIVRLTESDLTRIVKRIIKEQEEGEDNDGVVEYNDRVIMLDGATEQTVSRILRKLPKRLKFLAIKNCEYADFTGVDVCELPNLLFINLQGTDNNLEEVINCDFSNYGDNLFDLMK